MSEELPPSKLAQGVQGELIKIEDLPDGFYEGEESGENAGKPRYTASRFFRKRPQDYELCVAFLAAGQGLLKIARLLKVHHMTVAAVRDAEPAAIDIQKQRIRKNLRDAIDVAAERLPEIMATLPAGQLPVSAAILIDKLAQLEGEPTARVEVTVRSQFTHEAVLASLAAFPEAIEAELVQGAPQMVSRGGVAAQKGAAGEGLKAGSTPTEGTTDQGANGLG